VPTNEKEYNYISGPAQIYLTSICAVKAIDKFMNSQAENKSVLLRG
jgi:hypothetical protein